MWELLVREDAILQSPDTDKVRHTDRKTDRTGQDETRQDTTDRQAGWLAGRQTGNPRHS